MVQTFHEGVAVTGDGCEQLFSLLFRHAFTRGGSVARLCVRVFLGGLGFTFAGLLVGNLWLLVLFVAILWLALVLTLFGLVLGLVLILFFVFAVFGLFLLAILFAILRLVFVLFFAILRLFLIFLFLFLFLFLLLQGQFQVVFGIQVIGVQQ